ncbi:MAG: hypothetical protein J5702_02380 [Bacteroidales bacterium]|nr:hypothetical protein [Bacteroidales bacterium]
MLTDSSVDQIFENTWKEFTEYEYTNKERLALDYLDALVKEAGRRSDRLLPKMEAFIDAARERLGDSAVELTEKGFDVILPDQRFAITARRNDWFLLMSKTYAYSTDATIMEPQQAAILMDAAGHFMKKAGNRWKPYIKKRKEEDRIWEIECRYGRKKDELLDRFAYALADGMDTSDIAGAYQKLIVAEAAEKGTPLADAEIEALTAKFLASGPKAMKALIKRREAAEKARAKRIAKKQEEEQRYRRELQHLIETLGTEPKITRRTPFLGVPFHEYTFPLSNGQTISIKDRYKKPSRVEQFATTFMHELQTIIPYLSTKVRVTEERWASTPAMLKYYAEEALKALPDDSPFKNLVESTEIPQKTVSYHVNQRSFTCHYYFQQGEKRGLRLSLPLTLSAEQVEDFKNHFRALIRYDKSMRRWREPLEYGFDVPEKK